MLGIYINMNETWFPADISLLLIGPTTQVYKLHHYLFRYVGSFTTSLSRLNSQMRCVFSRCDAVFHRRHRDTSEYKK